MCHQQERKGQVEKTRIGGGTAVMGVKQQGGSQQRDSLMLFTREDWE